jgi:hypothetical protein
MTDVDYLLTPKAVRDKAVQILERNLHGEGQFFVDLAKLPDVAALVVKQIREKYPRLQIPYHSRWGHFRVGGVDRVADFMIRIEGLDRDEQARTMMDLVIVSVLLDAGAGPDWSYRDERGHVYSRSEGLAVASHDMFCAGRFSSNPKQRPLMADASGLMQVTEEIIAHGFQVSVGNPLLGVKGRAELLFRLGKSLVEDGGAGSGGSGGGGGKKGLDRPGRIFDLIVERATAMPMATSGTSSVRGQVAARHILDLVLRRFGSIWPGRIVMNDVNLGDCWRHEELGAGPEGFVPFHKLSQWLSYSLLEPLEHAGYVVTGLDELTGLAEYRNGGLMIDSGLITPKDGEAFEKPWPPDSKLVIEWRALTIALLDRLAPLVRVKLGRTAEEFPLVKMLEGGTWWTGRKLAQAARGGRSPIEIVSDGTVF